MKTVLGGVALAALIATASPGWAQTPMSPSTPMAQPKAAPSAAQSDAATGNNMAAVSTQSAPRRKRPVRSARAYPRSGYDGGSTSDHVADQLNAAELQSGGPPMGTPAGMPGYAAANYGGGYPPPPPGYGGPGFPPPPPWANAPPPGYGGPGYAPPPWAYRPY